MAVSIKNTTRRPLRGRRAFLHAAALTLPHWDISLVFVGEGRAKLLNKSLRGKVYTPNVLSYQVGPASGEIIICPSIAEHEAPEFGLTTGAYILYLFIHGLGHLAGRQHGATMERWEYSLLAKVAKVSTRIPHGTTHRNRHRHRHPPDQTGGGRRDRR